MTETDNDQIPKRDELDPAWTWDLESMYSSESAWEADYEGIDDLVQPLLDLKGTLNNPEALSHWYHRESDLDRRLEKLYVYAHLRSDEDTGNADHQARQSRIKSRYTAISSQLSWMLPEVLENDLEDLQSWMKDPSLEEFSYLVRQLIRLKPHTLSREEEAILSGAGELFANPSETYGLLTNADLEFPEIRDEQGRMRKLSQGRFITFLMNRNREVRKRAFEAMYETYGDVRNTVASTLSGAVKHHNFTARIRSHPSALESSLHRDDIPATLYTGLIESVHRELPAFFEYLDLRQDALSLKDLDLYDMYVPLVPAYDMHVEYEEACQWVQDACRPLGPEYTEALASAFRDRWIDVHENKGKRSGAYSSGCYDSCPYILMNYQGTLDHVFTLIHELGHSMHSLLANRTQPHHYADYTIFVAEIASTLNEELLLRYLLEKHEDPKIRAYLLNHMCDSFKGTVYRQTMFAEFEKLIHEMDAAGEPLTAKSLSAAYYALNKTYFGDAVDAHALIELEWARIPHFYYNFYVYKYSTSYCASQIFAHRVLESEAGRTSYLDMLKAGGSDAPLDLVRKAGVDLSNPETFTLAFTTFRQRVGELRTLLKEL